MTPDFSSFFPATSAPATATNPASQQAGFAHAEAEAARFLAQIGAILGALETSCIAAESAYSSNIAPATAAEGRLHDRFLQTIIDAADGELPNLSPVARYEHCSAFAAAIFGERSLQERWERGEGEFDAVSGDARAAFQIGRVFFDAPNGSATRFLLLAAAIVAMRGNENKETE